MTCRDYERDWNALIDMDRADARHDCAGAGPLVLAKADTERALLDHESDCAACRQLGARYLVLRRALQAGVQSRVAPAGLAGRILAEIERPSPSAWAVYGEARPERISPAAAVLAAIVTIAAVIALCLPSLNRALLRARLDRPATVLHPTLGPSGHDGGADSETVPAGARNLNTAVANATAATWDLARSASEPAARISRQVLNAATEADRESNLPTPDVRLEPVTSGVSVPSLAALAPDTAAAGAMLQQVGDHLATGVRPLSETARHAFGFLLGPAITKPEVPANPPAPKGA
jgi:hypothetical protein